MKLFVTYGCGTRLARNFSVVEAEDIPACYQIINGVTGGKYATSYTEESFAGQPEKYGLTEVPLQACSAYDKSGEDSHE